MDVPSLPGVCICLLRRKPCPCGYFTICTWLHCCCSFSPSLCYLSPLGTIQYWLTVSRPHHCLVRIYPYWAYGWINKTLLTKITKDGLCAIRKFQEPRSWFLDVCLKDQMDGLFRSISLQKKILPGKWGDWRSSLHKNTPLMLHIFSNVNNLQVVSSTVQFFYIALYLKRTV